jgi:predicted acylesterase/phospholipase RssA/CRP-like cAMP-binding protein
MNAAILSLLKVHEYFRGIPDQAMQEVLRDAKVTQHGTGDIVHEADALLTTIGFVLRGRLKAVRVDARGTESLFRMIERGEQFGMMVGAVSEPVPIRVVALEPSMVLRLDYEQALELTFRHPEVRRLWLTTVAGHLRKHFFGVTSKRAPAMLALIHESPATRPVAERLVGRLREVGEKLAVFTDSDDWRPLPDVRLRRLQVDGQMLAVDEVRRQAEEWHDANRIIFDVLVELRPERGERLMEIADRAVYFVPAAAGDAAVRRLQALPMSVRGWRDKTSIAWILERGKPVAPAAPQVREFVCRDFKIMEAAPELPWGRSLANGLERLVHELRGVRVGLALGGGGARGMAHLGVLKILEQAGIVVDMIAGTSAGAMTGILYASGLDPDYLARQFAADLRPSWIFRHLTRGSHWYLMYKYRRGHFDPMLRKYLQNKSLEKLLLPCLAITVDLVGGNYVVRDQGDAVHAILESINLPVLSVPICRNGQALVDGGLVNNIPANVLVSMDCNFVIAVSVTAKMEKEFCNVTPERPTKPGRTPSILETILRSLLVQSHSLNAHGVQPADVVIEPDVTGYDLAEFMRTKELAAIGETDTLGQVPKIKQLLARLDPQLFGPMGDTPNVVRPATTSASR